MVFLCVVVCSTRTWWACRCNSFVDFHEHKEQCKIEKWQSLRKRERERERERERWVFLKDGLQLCIMEVEFPFLWGYSLSLSLSLSRDKPLGFVYYCISFRHILCIFHRTVFVFVSEKNLEAFAPFHIHIPIQLWFICSFSTQKKKKTMIYLLIMYKIVCKCYIFWILYLTCW